MNKFILEKKNLECYQWQYKMNEQVNGFGFVNNKNVLKLIEKSLIVNLSKKNQRGKKR